MKERAKRGILPGDGPIFTVIAKSRTPCQPFLCLGVADCTECTSHTYFLALCEGTRSQAVRRALSTFSCWTTELLLLSSLEAGCKYGSEYATSLELKIRAPPAPPQQQSLALCGVRNNAFCGTRLAALKEYANNCGVPLHRGFAGSSTHSNLAQLGAGKPRLVSRSPATSALTCCRQGRRGGGIGGGGGTGSRGGT